MEYTINELVYGGKYHDAFWNPQYNALATITNGLADCTTFVIGACIVEGNPKPVSWISGASTWDENLTNGWTKVSYNKSKVKVGDIIQWKTKCHVAKVAKIVDGIIYVNGSFYTGEHGVSMWNGSYDTRTMFTSLQQLSDFMSQKYQDRFFHCWTIDKESQAVGSDPDNIFVMPDDLSPVPRNENVNQIQTLDNDLRIRTQPDLSGSIVGHVGIGYYNVLDTKKATDEDKASVEGLECWYEIAPSRWIANITTKYLPSGDEEDIVKLIKDYAEKMQRCIKTLTDENAELKEGMKQINEISARFIK